jgi:leader peptidase (prepilin peptidase) / N-methyltransferase
MVPTVLWPFLIPVGAGAGLIAAREANVTDPARRTGLIVLSGLLAGTFSAAINPDHLAQHLAAGLILATALPIAVVDAIDYRIPNRITYPLTIAVLGLAGYAIATGIPTRDAFTAGLGTAAAFLALHVISPRHLGFGDVKYMVPLAVTLGWFGWTHIYAGLMAGAVAGVIVTLALRRTGRTAKGTKVPFGVYLAAGTAVAGVIAGDQIASALLGNALQ